MTALPPSTDFTGAAVTEAQFKTAVTALRDFLSGLLGSDGTLATALDTLGALGSAVTSKSGAYTVVAADRGTVFECSGTWTLSLTAAATLGSGFNFCVVNTGSGTITIDPNGSELIDGASTITVGAGASCWVSCNGTAFRSIGKINQGSGSGLDADLLDGNHASAFATSGHNHSGVYVAVDNGHGSVGSFCFAYVNTTTTSAGSTVAGSLLYPASANGDYPGTALSGTWRCLGYALYGSAHTQTTLWQRIA